MFFKKLGKNPKAYISAAAIGYYGERGNTLVNESSAPGEGFLAESCIAWENAIKEVADAGIRTAWIRIGIVMSKQGGAMPKMLIPFYFFMGSYFGNGQQWYSWIHIDDLVSIFSHIIKQEIGGIFNAVAPNPVRQSELVTKIAIVLKKPLFLPKIPDYLLKLFLGDMSAIILESQRVCSKKIQQSGYKFKFHEIGPALENILRS